MLTLLQWFWVLHLFCIYLSLYKSIIYLGAGFTLSLSHSLFSTIVVLVHHHLQFSILLTIIVPTYTYQDIFLFKHFGILSLFTLHLFYFSAVIFDFSHSAILWFYPKLPYTLSYIFFSLTLITSNCTHHALVFSL